MSHWPYSLSIGDSNCTVCPTNIEPTSCLLDPYSGTWTRTWEPGPKYRMSHRYWYQWFPSMGPVLGNLDPYSGTWTRTRELWIWPVLIYVLGFPNTTLKYGSISMAHIYGNNSKFFLSLSQLIHVRPNVDQLGVYFTTTHCVNCFAFLAFQRKCRPVHFGYMWPFCAYFRK